MPPLQKTLALLFLLFATTTTALPGTPKFHKNRRPGQPWASCEIEEKSPRDAYRLEGINWNVTEAQLKAEINGSSDDGVVLTAWEWKVWVINDQGVERFEAKFKLPIDQGKKTMKKLKKLVEPWEMDINPYPYPGIAG